MAKDAYEQLEIHAVEDIQAKELLSAASNDLTEIARIRNQVLARLDQNRSFYAELLNDGQSNFAPYLTRSLTGLRDQSRSASVLERSVIDDANNFIRHAQESASEEKRGSFGWLAEFMPAN